MKKLALVAAVVALVTVAPAHASMAVPEPSSFVQLAAGLFVLGGLALFARKRVSSTDTK
jgi:protein-S-isoprenylcysteine O-methyltransferase Ste14